MYLYFLKQQKCYSITHTRSGHILQNANMLLTTPLPEPRQTAAPAGRNIRQGVPEKLFRLPQFVISV